MRSDDRLCEVPGLPVTVGGHDFGWAGFPPWRSAGGGGTDGDPKRRSQNGRSFLPVLLPVLALSVLALVGVTYTLPYYLVGPAPAQRVDDLVQVPDEHAFAHTGDFLFTTVALKEATALDAVRGWLDRDTDVVKFQRLTGVKATREARRQFDADLRRSMQTSQHVAVAVALRRLGLSPEKGTDVRIAAGDVTGGSAGLAITLGLLDLLGSGELTGGHRVAVSGTIRVDGGVGEVDGVAQKAAAARHANADYMLVPPGGFDTAVARAGTKMKVLQVATLDEALAALAGIGGDIGAPAPRSTGT